MNILLSLILFATTTLVVESKDVLFAFTDGDYANHETWRWDAITHLGFWTEPSDDVRATAKQNGVQLLADAGLPDKKTWTDENSRKEFAQEKADLVKSKNLDGVFFDYEGNDLNKDEKNAFALLAKEVKDATNGTLVICVGGRPSYEWRDYPYADLAESSDFLFVMGYDLIAWDDYTCITKGTCSPADAPIKDLELGLTEYLKDVPSSKLVLGLPWYGNRYTDIIVPFNDGQIDYKDVLEVYDNNKVKETRFDKDSQTYVAKCDGACVDGKKGATIWFDNEITLRTKYKLANKYNLLGVGMWAVDKLPGPNEDGSDPHKANRTAMWDSIVSWNSNSSIESSSSSSFEATSYLTSNTFPSKDKPARLSKSTIQFNSTKGKSDLVTLSFDATKTMQTVLGFGGAITDSVAHVFNEMSEDRQKEAVEALFGSTGQKYNLVRMTIGSTDFSTTVYNYNSNKNDFNQSLFSIEHDKKQIIPLAKLAVEANSQLEILSSPWSPPGWMKVGWLLELHGYFRNSAKPGMIQQDKVFESYALYTSKYISAMKEEGLTVSRITIQNEPDSADHMVVAAYPACNFNGTDEGLYLKNHLGPRIRKDHPDVKIYIHDGQKFHDVPIKNRVDDILKAVGGLESGFVDGVAFHWYGDNLKNFQYLGDLRAAYPELPLLATEATLKDPRTQTDPWGEAMKYAIDIVGDLQNGAEGWIEWNVLLESNGGPTCIGPTETTICTPEIGHCDAPLLYKKSSDEIEYRGTYHFMAHFSRFMERGDLIVNATLSSDGDTPLRSVASVSSDGSKMNVVVLNTDEKNTVQYNLDVGLGSVASSISLPPRSIQTIVVNLK